MRIAMLAVSLALAGCLPTRFEPPAPMVAPAPTPTVLNLERGAYSGITEAQTVVVRDRAAWATLLERVSVGRAPHARPPAVDFGHEMVVGVFLGTRRTGGYQVEIRSVGQEADALVVRWRETSPPPGTLVTQALTAPYHLVKIAAHPGPVRFVRD